jgi:hypothetical protein
LRENLKAVYLKKFGSKANLSIPLKEVLIYKEAVREQAP